MKTKEFEQLRHWLSETGGYFSIHFADGTSVVPKGSVGGSFLDQVECVSGPDRGQDLYAALCGLEVVYFTASSVVSVRHFEGLTNENKQA